MRTPRPVPEAGLVGIPTRADASGSPYMMEVVTPEGASTATIAAQSATISTLRPGAEVDAIFACVRKDRLLTRSGAPYLALELRDRTGTLSARAFRDADAL